MASFEIELRGLLKNDQRETLEKFLAKNGKLIRKYERKQWIFGVSHSKKIDLRLKETNQNFEFSLKVGQLGKKSRREISIPFASDKADEALEFLKFLGKKEGFIAIRNASIYQYKDIEWAIVEVPNHSYYFEAEKLVASEEDGARAKKEISKIVNELNLKLFNAKEYFEYLKSLDTDANEKFIL